MISAFCPVGRGSWACPARAPVELYGFATEPPKASRPCRVTIPHANAGRSGRCLQQLPGKATASGRPSPGAGAKSGCFAPAPAAPVQARCWLPLAAAMGRSPRGVRCPSWIAPSTVSQISSPLWPTLRQDRECWSTRFVFLRGVSIKLRFTNPPPSEPQSRRTCRHGEELRETVQARAACTGNRQLLTGSESRDPVQLKTENKPGPNGQQPKEK